MLCQKVYSDILPHFGGTSCLAPRDILPWRGRNFPSWGHPASPISPSACFLARQQPQRRHNTMFTKDPDRGDNYESQAHQGWFPVSENNPAAGTL